MIFAVFLLFCFIFPRPVFAASKYWIGSEGGNISDVANWASSEGACGVGTTVTAPGASDIAYFTSSCTNAATINQAWSIQGINIAGGAITQSAALTVGVSGFTQTAGTFTGSSSGDAIDIAGSFSLTGGTMTATSGVLSTERSFTISNATFNHNSGTATLDGTYCTSTSIDASGIVFNKVTISRTLDCFYTNVILTIAAGTTLPLGDTPTLTYKNTRVAGSSYATLTNNGTLTTGSGKLTVDMAGYLYSYFHNKGTLNFDSSSSIVFNGRLINYIDKTFSAKNSTTVEVVSIGNSGTINTDIGSTFTIKDLTTDANSQFITANNPTFNVAGSFIVDSGSTFPTSGVDLNITGSYCVDPVIDSPSIIFNKVTINKTNNSGCNANKTLTINAGTTIPLGDNPTITLDNSASAYNFNLVNNGTITTGTGTLTLNLYQSSSFTNGTSGRLIGNSLSGFTTISGIRNSGYIDLSNINTFTFGRSLIQSASAEFFTASNPTFNVAGSFIINSGSTFPSSGVDLNITGDACISPTIDASSITFNKVTIDKTSTNNDCYNNLTLTIATGTTVPLGNDPTIKLKHYYPNSYDFDLINNGTITTGTGTLTLNLFETSSFTNGTTGRLLGSSLSGFTTTSGIGNSGYIDLSNINTFTFGRSLIQSASAEFFTASNPTFNVAGSFIINSGSTFPSSGVDLNITGDACISPTIDASSITFNKVTIDKTSTNNDCYNNLTLTIATGTTVPLGNDPTIKLKHYYPNSYDFDLINNGTITLGTGTLNLTLYTTSTFTTNGTINASSLSTANIRAYFSQGSTANFIGSDNLNIGFSGTVDIDSGSSFPSTLGTLTINNSTSYNNPKTTTYTSFIKNGSATLALGQGFTTADFSISAGTISNPATSQTINVTGNFSQTGGTLGGANLPIVFLGGETQTITKSGGTFSSPITINKSGSYVSLSSTFANAAGQACTVAEGIFDLNGQSFTCGGDFVVQNGGTLRMVGNETPTTPTLDTGSIVSFKGDGDAAPDTFTITGFGTSFKNLSIENSSIGGTDTFVLGEGITVAGNLTISSGILDVGNSEYPIVVSGNWTNNASFTHRNGTVTFIGTGQSLAGTTVFYNFTKNVTSADTLVLPGDASKLQTFEGLLNLKGTSGNLLTLQSSVHETQAKINRAGTTDLAYLAVHDINNTGTSIDVAGLNITDLGNNLGFNFNTAPTASTPSSITQITDMSGYVSFVTTIGDTDLNGTKLKVEYSDDNGSTWYDPVLVSVVGSTGSPNLNNSDTYQIGTSTPISTSLGNITLTIVWNTKSASNGHGSMDNTDQSDIKIRVTSADTELDSEIATSDAFRVDNIVPTVSIGEPSASLTKNGPITYTITYTGADTVTLADGNVTLNKTSTANGTAIVSGSGTATRTITVNSITGNGTLGISLAAATASDTAGNTTAAAGPSTNFTVDNTIPVITRLGKAVVKIYKNTNYSDSGASASDNIDGNITSRIITSGLDEINTAIGGTYEITYDVGDTVGNNATQVVRTVHILDIPTSSQILGTGATTTVSNPTIVIGDNNTSPATISVPSNVTNATLNVSAITVSSGTTTSVSLPSSINLNVGTTFGTVVVSIPSGVEMVAASGSWNGNINVPQVRENPSIAPSVDVGKTANVSTVIEVGYGDTQLTFDKAVRILIPNQAGKYIGYARGSTFYEITATCSADTQEAGDALSAAGDCKKDVGADLVIWTKHFTEFTTYIEEDAPVPTSTPTSTPTPTSAPSNNNNNNNNNNNSSSSSGSSSSSSSAPSCNNALPPTPQITAIRFLKSGTVRVFWNHQNSTTSWTVLYGNRSSDYPYGVHNFGDNISRSIDVGGLKTGTYYFVLRANNGCRPGSNSIEWRVTVSRFGASARRIGYVTPVTPTVKKTTTPTKTTTTKSTKTQTVAPQITQSPPPVVQEPQPAQQITPNGNNGTSAKKKRCFLWWCW